MAQIPTYPSYPPHPPPTHPPNPTQPLQGATLNPKPNPNQPNPNLTQPLQGATSVTPVDEEGLVFLGLLAMHDPPRKECAAALDTCRRAGVRVIMVTGDNKATAESVFRQVGGLREDQAYQGQATCTGEHHLEFGQGINYVYYQRNV